MQLKITNYPCRQWAKEQEGGAIAHTPTEDILVRKSAAVRCQRCQGLGALRALTRVYNKPYVKFIICNKYV